MECDLCRTNIEPGEEREHRGQVLCEDCLMDALAAVRICDPWAVHSAKSLERNAGSPLSLTATQSEILEIVTQAESIEPETLLARLDNRLTMKDLEREFATLRHMEKVRGEKRGDRVFLRLW